MEILILIGIFAFVIAILFRSNEALDRVGEVEKEMKTIEQEIGHKEPSAESTPVITENTTPPIMDAEMKSKIESANPVNTPFPESVNVRMD